MGGGLSGPVAAELLAEAQQRLTTMEADRATLAQTRLEMEATRVLLERCQRRERLKRQGKISHDTKCAVRELTHPANMARDGGHAHAAGALPAQGAPQAPG